MYMKTRYVALAALGLFVITRKKYYLENLDILIPNTSLLGIQSKSNNSIINIIKKNINVQLKGDQWLITINPIDGITIPYKAVLPITAPIAIPQILAQIGSKIKLKNVYKFGILIGKRLTIQGVSFYG